METVDPGQASAVVLFFDTIDVTDCGFPNAASADLCCRHRSLAPRLQRKPVQLQDVGEHIRNLLAGK